MIIAPLSSKRLAIVTQTDHARLSAELLSLWRRDGLPDYPWREELLFAAGEHDNGWAEADSAPMVDPVGKPYDFIDIPTEARQEIWHRGVQRYMSDRPLVALWITRHALHLHRTRVDDPDWQEPLSIWRELAGALMQEGGWSAEDVDTGYAWIDLSDTVSLVACARYAEPLSCRGTRIRPIPGDEPESLYATVELSPFPLAGSTTFSITARIIEDRAYSDGADLALAMAGARWQRFVLRICPGPVSGIR